MTDQKVNILGGILKAAGYRSVAAFIERYRRAHIEAGGDFPAALRMQFRGALRAATRGLGPPRRAEAFSISSLEAAVDMYLPAVATGPVYPGRFVIIGMWWLMREVEVSLPRVEQVVVEGPLVTLDLSATRTDRGEVREM